MKFLFLVCAAAFLAVPGAADAQARKQADPYGQWNKSWGTKPPAPPKHWSNKSDWHRHVRACQNSYRSYNPRTDTYKAGAGKQVRCRL